MQNNKKTSDKKDTTIKIEPKTDEIRKNDENDNALLSDVPDLDGDGMIGHTGGLYGDTTYTGGSIIGQTGLVEDAPEIEKDVEGGDDANVSDKEK